MGESRCGEVAVWGSCGVGELWCGEFVVGGVALWRSCSVEELQCMGVAVQGRRGVTKLYPAFCALLYKWFSSFVAQILKKL